MPEFVDRFVDRVDREFAAIVQALEQVLRAAIETGNPVIWG